MSQLTKRKYVTKETLDEFKLPEKDQRVVQVIAGKGNNLHQVVDPSVQSDDKTYLVSMPPKFRKNVWIKRGDFVMVEPIQEGDKVKAEIIQVLYKEQIKYIKKEGLWPNFQPHHRVPSPKTEKKKIKTEEGNSNSSSEEDDSDLFQNPNRPVIETEEYSESSEEEEED